MGDDETREFSGPEIGSKLEKAAFEGAKAGAKEAINEVWTGLAERAKAQGFDLEDLQASSQKMIESVLGSILG